MRSIYRQQLGIFVGALLIGLGIAYGGVALPERMFALMALESFSLILIMGVVVAMIVVTYLLLPKYTGRPLFTGYFEYREHIPGMHVLIGGIFFGVGLGIAGMSPTTALVALGMGLPNAIYSVFGVAFGVTIAALFYKQ